MVQGYDPADVPVETKTGYHDASILAYLGGYCFALAGKRFVARTVPMDLVAPVLGCSLAGYY